MKRLIIISKEIDGHSEADVFIATSKALYDEFIRDTLYSDNNLRYTFTHEDKEAENITTFYYVGDEGEISIKVICFSKYKELENTQFISATR